MVIDPLTDPEIGNLFYKEPTKAEVSVLRAFLKAHKYDSMLMYHGTSSRHSIQADGFKPTSASRRNSLQSRSGYVSFSVFWGMSETFAKMAYPMQDVTIYAVRVPIYDMVGDADQLRNKAIWGGVNLGKDVAASLLVGHGIQVKGRVNPAQIAEAKTIKI